MKRLGLIAAAGIFLLMGCGAERSADDSELMVSAAASLTDALEEIKEQFEKEQQGAAVRYNFGSSGKLASAIENGAPADVFLSASKTDMDRLENDGLIDVQTREDFTRNTLVLIADLDNTAGAASFEELKQAPFSHLAAGEFETVPAGRYTKEALASAGLLEPLRDKLVFGSDVRQVLTQVELGNAEYGIVYASDALISNQVQVIAHAEAGWHEPIVYPGAVILGSAKKETAQAFLNFIMSDQGRRILDDYGFQ